MYRGIQAMQVNDIHTLIAEALADFAEPDGGVVAGIQPSTTFQRDSDHELLGDFIYRRNGSPTVSHAESALTTIDGGEDGLLFSSGMAAFTCFMAALPRGARIVAPRVMYHGAQDWLFRLHERGDVDLALFNDISAEGLAEALDGGADLIWIETPVNPTWDVIDIRKAASLAASAGAILAVDSTVAPAVTTRPLTLGADVVFQSATKYLNGHSDVTGGVLATAERNAFWEDVRSIRVSLGSVISPFEAWLLMRGLRTLGVRYERASTNALAVAQSLEENEKISHVLYPGLPSHHQHDVAARQMTGGFGGMLSILVNGDTEQTRRVASEAELFTSATSLGGTESLIEHRSSVEGPHSIVPENLLRISAGLESADDLVADINQAITKAFQ